MNDEISLEINERRALAIISPPCTAPVWPAAARRNKPLAQMVLLLYGSNSSLWEKNDAANKGNSPQTDTRTCNGELCNPSLRMRWPWRRSEHLHGEREGFRSVRLWINIAARRG